MRITVDGGVDYGFTGELCIHRRVCAFTGEFVLNSADSDCNGAGAQNSCHSAFAAGEKFMPFYDFAKH